MSRTTPLADLTINRISDRIRAIRNERDWNATSATTMCLRTPATCGQAVVLTDNVVDLVAAGYRLWEPCDNVFLTITPTTTFEILAEVKAASTEGGADTAGLFDQRDLEALFLEKRGDAKYEWDEYPEPLWDPLESEVELLVREYFEQADADSD